MTTAEIAGAIEHGFQVTKDGVVYDIGVAEGGETVCAWRAPDPEEARAVMRFGTISPSHA